MEAIHSPQTKEAGFKLYCKGIALAEIARRLDVPFNTLRTWSYQRKWKTRRMLLGKDQRGLSERVAAGARAAMDANDSQVGRADAALLLEIENLSFAEKQDRFRAAMAAQAMRIPAILAGMGSEELVKNAERLAKLEGIARRALCLEDAVPVPVVHVALLTANPTVPPLERAPALGEGDTDTGNLAGCV